MDISQSASISAVVPETDDLQLWARAALDQCQLQSFALRIVSVAEMRELNGSFAGRHKPTNVLSFPSPPLFEDMPASLQQSIQAEHQSLGDIAICAEIVEAEAREQRKQLDAHWAHMIVHGVLHLRGYDHLRDEDAELMEQEEIRILTLLGFGDPYNAGANTMSQRGGYE